MKKTIKEIIAIAIALFLAFMAVRLLLFVFNVAIWTVINVGIIIAIFVIATPLYIIARKKLLK